VERQGSSLDPGEDHPFAHLRTLFGPKLRDHA
jgi:hypothetical protein